jgi:hypothetical protein
MLHDIENLPRKSINKDYQKGFRILKQYQIKEIFWRESNQSKTSEWRNQVWDAIHITEAERKHDISSGTLKHQRKVAAKVIKENMDKDTSSTSNKIVLSLTSVPWGITWKVLNYIISQKKFGSILTHLIIEK